MNMRKILELEKTLDKVELDGSTTLSEMKQRLVENSEKSVISKKFILDVIKQYIDNKIYSPIFLKLECSDTSLQYFKRYNTIIKLSDYRLAVHNVSVVEYKNYLFAANSPYKETHGSNSDGPTIGDYDSLLGCYEIHSVEIVTEKEYLSKKEEIIKAEEEIDNRLYSGLKGKAFFVWIKNIYTSVAENNFYLYRIYEIDIKNRKVNYDCIEQYRGRYTGPIKYGMHTKDNLHYMSSWFLNPDINTSVHEISINEFEAAKYDLFYFGQETNEKFFDHYKKMYDTK